MIEERLAQNATLIERALTARYETQDADFDRVRSAEQYALFARAKRIRPTLVLEFCRMHGGADEAALPFACAVEMLHTYSLVHDDLPCMDNDDLRRGKPTVHKAFDEATAVLAGDALLTAAFETIAENAAVSPKVACKAVSVLARAAGDFGMIGGQVMDLAGEGEELSLRALEKLHANKTGALIVACAKLGCLAAGLDVADERTLAAARYAAHLGLAFQIVDDVLDATANSETLGKTAGSDKRENKTTFLTYYAPEEARTLAGVHTQYAKEALIGCEHAEILCALADHLERRLF